MGSTTPPPNPTTTFHSLMGDPNSMANGKLSETERFWRNHYDLLKQHGYTLRTRYQPDWVASWLGTSKDWWTCKDGVHIAYGQVLDATRADGSLVIVKRVDTSLFPAEITVGKHFSSEPLASQPKNHCVPILDVIQPTEGSKYAFLVMPLLFRIRITPFETMGEVVEFFRQLFEGLQFMHENNVCHGDCKYDNILADTLCLFDAPPHPCKPSMKRDFSGRTSKPASRIRKPVKYYLVDFGLSNIYQPKDAPHLEEPPWGGDKTVPEFLVPDPAPCDPFPVDVYCLGNAIRRNFLDGRENLIKPKRGFEFMRELISDMVNDDPSKRPAMSEVTSRFEDIVKGLSNWKLRSRVIDVDEPGSTGFFRSTAHWTRQLGHIVRGCPSIPRA
ncbi:kinase-like domain-containing protein [Lyophyllum atratum]|nr:kinase-like domain-containing protein [Lyophyllum atratum]